MLPRTVLHVLVVVLVLVVVALVVVLVLVPVLVVVPRLIHFGVLCGDPYFSVLLIKPV